MSIDRHNFCALLNFKYVIPHLHVKFYWYKLAFKPWFYCEFLYRVVPAFFLFGKLWRFKMSHTLLPSLIKKKDSVSTSAVVADPVVCVCVWVSFFLLLIGGRLIFCVHYCRLFLSSSLIIITGMTTLSLYCCMDDASKHPNIIKFTMCNPLEHKSTSLLTI